MADFIQEIAAVSALPLQEQDNILLPAEDRIVKQKVKGAERNYFLKTASIKDLQLLMSEKTGLDALTIAGALRVPKVFFIGETSTCSFLIWLYP